MMDIELAEMLDHFKIRQVLERYCRGVDRMDKELIESVYWPEAVDNHGVYVGSGVKFATFLIDNFRAYTATMHVIAQSNIEVNGAKAVGETYYIAGHRSTPAADRVTFMTAWGRYVDAFEKRGDEWRIAERVVVVEHLSEEPDVKSGSLPLDVFHPAQRNRSDLSYVGRRR